MVLKINEIREEHLVKNISMGKMVNAVKTIIKEVKEYDGINYFDLESLKYIYLVRLSIKEDNIEIFEDIYKTYDEIMNSNVVNLIQENVDNNFDFYILLEKEVEKLEKQFDKRGTIEDNIGNLIDTLIITINKMSDKKYMNSILKTILTNTTQENQEKIRLMIADIKETYKNKKEMQTRE